MKQMLHAFITLLLLLGTRICAIYVFDTPSASIGNKGVVKVKLARAPTADVMIYYKSTTLKMNSCNPLVFNVANWNVFQNISVNDIKTCMYLEQTMNHTLDLSSQSCDIGFNSTSISYNLQHVIPPCFFCKGWGDPHFQTFDSVLYATNTDEGYFKMVQAAHLDVDASFEKCHETPDGSSYQICINKVAIRYGKTLVKVDLVPDGLTVYKPELIGSNLDYVSVYALGKPNSWRVSFGASKIEFSIVRTSTKNKYLNVYVHLDLDYQSVPLLGLCNSISPNNLNGKLKALNGSLYSAAVTNEIRQFVNSYRIQPTLFQTTSVPTQSATDTPRYSTCTGNPNPLTCPVISTPNPPLINATQNDMLESYAPTVTFTKIDLNSGSGTISMLTEIIFKDAFANAMVSWNNTPISLPNTVPYPSDLVWYQSCDHIPGFPKKRVCVLNGNFNNFCSSNNSLIRPILNSGGYYNQFLKVTCPLNVTYCTTGQQLPMNLNFTIVSTSDNDVCPQIQEKAENNLIGMYSQNLTAITSISNVNRSNSVSTLKLESPVTLLFAITSPFDLRDIIVSNLTFTCKQNCTTNKRMDLLSTTTGSINQYKFTRDLVSKKWAIGFTPSLYKPETELDPTKSPLDYFYNYKNFGFTNTTEQWEIGVSINIFYVVNELNILNKRSNIKFISKTVQVPVQFNRPKRISNLLLKNPIVFATSKSKSQSNHESKLSIKSIKWIFIFVVAILIL